MEQFHCDTCSIWIGETEQGFHSAHDLSLRTIPEPVVGDTIRLTEDVDGLGAQGETFTVLAVDPSARTYRAVVVCGASGETALYSDEYVVAG